MKNIPLIDVCPIKTSMYEGIFPASHVWFPEGRFAACQIGWGHGFLKPVAASPSWVTHGGPWWIWLGKLLRAECPGHALFHTVDGRNPALVDRWFIPLFIGFQPSKVVQDFATINNMFQFKSVEAATFPWENPIGWWICPMLGISDRGSYFKTFPL